MGAAVTLYSLSFHRNPASAQALPDTLWSLFWRTALSAGVKWSIKGLDKGSGPFKINFI
jgi:hypothetical protein